MIEWLSVILLSMSPISELKGAIPLGIALGLDPYTVFLVAVLFNILVFFPIFFVLKFFYYIFERFKFVRKLIETIRKRGKFFVERYGLAGIFIISAIPIPGFGAWTAIAIAWLFDLDWKKSLTAISYGTLISGIIILFVALSGLKLLGGLI
jgi:uncharacterized membrane protein